MKVRELIEALKREDPEAELYVSEQSGDHWQTVKLVELESVMPTVAVHSVYHDCLVEKEERDDDEEEPVHVLVLDGGNL